MWRTSKNPCTKYLISFFFFLLLSLLHININKEIKTKTKTKINHCFTIYVCHTVINTALSRIKIKNKNNRIPI